LGLKVNITQKLLSVNGSYGLCILGILGLAILKASKEAKVIRVLHVDTDPSFLEISKLMLQDLNSDFEIDQAMDVDEAFRKLAVGVYDVVVSDYEMPLKNGLDFLKEIRQHNSEIPFILFTGKGREEVAIKALNLGANGYINKQDSPVTVYSELSHLIRTLVHHRTAEWLLSKSEERFEKMITNSKDLIILTQPDGITAYVSPSCKTILGYEQNELIGTLPNIIHPDDSERMQKILTSAFSQIYENGRLTQIVSNLVDITELKKTAEALRNSEEQTRSVFAASPYALTICDLTGYIIDCNEATVALHDYVSKDELIGKNVLDLIAEKDHIRMLQEMIAPPVRNLEFTFVAKGGREFPVEMSANVVLDASGNPTAYMAITKDLTERRQWERNLQVSEERLKKSQEVAHIAHWDWIVQTGELVWCEEFYCIFGLPRETGPSFENFLKNIHPDDVEFVKQSIAEALKGLPHNVVFRIIRPDGAERFLNGTGEVSFDLEGKPTRMFGIVQDITERENAKNALRASEEKFRSIVENSSDQIFLLDKNYKYLSVNKTLADVLGKVPDKIIGKSISEIYPAETAAQFSGNIKNVFATGTSVFTEEKMVAQDKELYISTSLNPVKDVKGTVIAVIGIVRDVTERKKSEEKIQLLSSIIEQTSTGIAVSDLQGKILYVNPAWLNLHSFAENEEKNLVGDWIMKFYYHQPIEILNCDVKPGCEFRGRIKQVKKDGSTFMSLTSLSPLRNVNGDIMGIIHSVKNLTEIVRDISDVKLPEFCPIHEKK
jgi:PAS domain S-box-containing protein